MPRTQDFALILTCEHGGNRVPAAYRSLFRRAQKTLTTHRGYDIGALDAARRLKRRFDAPLVFSTTTRLLIDLNRSAHNRSRFSEFTRDLAPEVKAQLDADFHAPYWESVRTLVRRTLREHARVLLFSVHTFTPRLNGKTRETEIGWLYDPQRKTEQRFAQQQRHVMLSQQSEFRVRMNYPYQGKNDAVATRLRWEFPPTKFLGVEIEINQGLYGTAKWPRVCTLIGDALKTTLVAGANAPTVRI